MSYSGWRTVRHFAGIDVDLLASIYSIGELAVSNRNKISVNRTKWESSLT